jgi:hypothetical protein
VSIQRLQSHWGFSELDLERLIDSLADQESVGSVWCSKVDGGHTRIAEGVPVTLRIRSGRIRWCREDARCSRIAKWLVPDRFGWVPGMASMSSLCGDAVLFAGGWPRWPKAFAAHVG